MELVIKKLLPAQPSESRSRLQVSSVNGRNVLATSCGFDVAVFCGESLRVVGVLSFEAQVSALHFSPSGNEIAVAVGSRVEVCDLLKLYGQATVQVLPAVACRSALFETPWQPLSISWSPCGNFILCGERSLALWQLVTPAHSWDILWTSTEMPHAVSDLSFCPRGRFFASSCIDDNDVGVWYHGGGSVFSSVKLRHSRPVLCATWKQHIASEHGQENHNAGGVLLTKSSDLIIRIWVETPQSDHFGFSLVSTIDCAGIHSACWIQNVIPSVGRPAVKSQLLSGHGHSVSQSWEMSHWGPYPRRSEQSDWLLGVTEEELLVWRIQGLNDLPGPETRIVQWATNAEAKALVDLPFSNVVAVGPSCIDGTCTVYGVSETSSSICRLHLHLAQGIPPAERPISVTGLPGPAAELLFSPSGRFLALRTESGGLLVLVSKQETFQSVLIQQESEDIMKLMCWASADTMLAVTTTSKICVFHCLEDHAMYLGSIESSHLEGVRALCATTIDAVSFVLVLDAAGSSFAGYTLWASADPVKCVCEERIYWTRTTTAAVTKMTIMPPACAQSPSTLSMLLGCSDGRVHLVTADFSSRQVEIIQTVVMSELNPVTCLQCWDCLRFAAVAGGTVEVFERESTCREFVQEFLQVEKAAHVVQIATVQQTRLAVCAQSSITLWQPKKHETAGDVAWENVASLAMMVHLQQPITGFAASENILAVSSGTCLCLVVASTTVKESGTMADHEPEALMHFLREGRIQTVERIIDYVVHLPHVVEALSGQEGDMNSSRSVDDDNDDNVAAIIKKKRAISKLVRFKNAVARLQGFPLSVTLPRDEQQQRPELDQWQEYESMLESALSDEFARVMFVIVQVCKLSRSVYSAVDKCGHKFLGPALCVMTDLRISQVQASGSSKGDDSASPIQSQTEGLSTRMFSLASSDLAWAFFSDSHEALLQACLPAEATWTTARILGLGMWPRSNYILKSLMERCAKNQFTRDKNPSDSLLLYLALGKKNAVLGLYKAVKDTKLATFLQNDFEEERWKTAALRNAYVLMGQHKFEMAAAFFLLGGQVEDALNVCSRQMHDTNLAICIARLVAGDGSELHSKVLRNEVIPVARQNRDPILQCIAHWSLGEYRAALQCLDVKRLGASDFVRPFCARIRAYLSTKPAIRALDEPGGEDSADAERAGVCAFLQASSGYHTLGLDTLALDSILESPALNAPVQMDLASKIAGLVMMKAHLTPHAALDNLKLEHPHLSSDLQTLRTFGLESIPSRLASLVPQLFLAPKALLAALTPASGWTLTVGVVRHVLEDLCRASLDHMSARGSNYTGSLRSQWCNAYNALTTLDERARKGWDSSQPTQCDSVVAAVALCLGTFVIAWASSDIRSLMACLQSWPRHQHLHSSQWLQSLPASVRDLLSSQLEGVVASSKGLVGTATQPFVTTFVKCLISHKFVCLMRQYVLRSSGRGQNDFLLDILAKIQIHSDMLADRLSRIWPADPKAYLQALPRIHSTLHLAEANPLHRSLSAQQLSEKARGLTSSMTADDLNVGRESSHWSVEEESAEKKSSVRKFIGTVCSGNDALEEAWMKLTADSDCRHLVVRIRLHLQSIIRNYMPLPTGAPLFDEKPATLFDGTEVIRGLAVDMRGDYVAASTLRSIREVHLGQPWLQRPSIDRPSLGSSPAIHPRKVPRQNSIFQPVRPEPQRPDVREPQHDLLKEGSRSGNAIHALAGHPSLPMYLGVDDGEVMLFAYGHTTLSRPIRLVPLSVKATSAKWSPCGAHFGISNSAGGVVVAPLGIFAASHTTVMPQQMACHSKRADDLVFLNSATAVATAGTSFDKKNICIWDLMLPGSSACAESITAHDGGATCITYSSMSSTLVSGGRMKDLVLWDPRMEASSVLSPAAHNGPVQALAAFPAFDYIIASGGADGSVKLWDLRMGAVVQTWERSHTPHSVITKASQDPETRGVLSIGVSAIAFLPGALVTAGGDGTVNFHRLL